MARIVIAGAGAIGASIAYHLALLGARDVVLCDRAEIASGATGKAMGGFRQQFSTEAEVLLARRRHDELRERRRERRDGTRRARGKALRDQRFRPDEHVQPFHQVRRKPVPGRVGNLQPAEVRRRFP